MPVIDTLVHSGISLRVWTDYRVHLGSSDVRILRFVLMQSNRIAALKLGHYHLISGMLRNTIQ